MNPPDPSPDPLPTPPVGPDPRPLLRPLAQRLRSERLAWTLAAAGSLALAGLLTIRYARLPLQNALLWTLLCAAGALLAALRLARTPPERALAKRIERFDPALEGRLLTALDHAPQAPPSFLQNRLLLEVAEYGARSRWQDALPPWRLALARAGCRASLLTLLLSLLLWPLLPISHLAPHSPSAQSQPPAARPPEVSPGDVSLEKGSRLAVTARLENPLPEVFLVLGNGDSEKGNGASQSEPLARIPMQQGLAEALYGAAVPSVDAPLVYWVESPAGSSPHFKVDVFEFPKLLRSDALVHYPKGSEPAERRFENAHKLTVPEGSDIEWNLQVNKPLRAARLLVEKGDPIPLGAANDPQAFPWKLSAIRTPLAAKLQLEDAEGRLSKELVPFEIQVIPNQPPKIRPLLPRPDARFTAIEEIDFQAEAWDDASLQRWGLTLQFGSAPPKEIVLGEHSRGSAKVSMHTLFPLETLTLQPGDSATWFFWAEDLDPSGNLRRTESDLFLGRIRPFEEEYRKGAEEEGEPGKFKPQILELQKQVLSATWNLRRNNAPQSAPPKDKALETIQNSEKNVLQLATESAEEEPPGPRKTRWQKALAHLEKAVAHLASRNLDAALPEEIAAYDALTHLAPSRYQMNKSKGKPNPNQETTRQMNHLEFAREEDRYESKKQAKNAAQDSERSEMEELLAQLRALARRQDEVSERMRELEAQIRSAQTQDQKDEARRELKKLAEEQQALAQALEDAQQKAAQKGESLAKQTEQLDAARQAAQNAASAAEQGQLDQARAAATQSAEQLRQGTDSLRQQLSGKNREDAKDLRDQAEQLAAREKQLAEQLTPSASQPKKLNVDSLALLRELESQRQRLRNLQSDLQRVSESAEASEPGFSKALQEAHRETLQNQTDEKLRIAASALASAQTPIARRAESAANQDLQSLAEAVEKASDQVLGEDAQALR
ncbi:MAG: hypothetical protein RLZZ244_1601, partial [Verrucomicrobiota bacterium]